MSCMEHYCDNCKAYFMNNEIYKLCCYCKSPLISNWFDEEVDMEKQAWEDDDE